MFHFFTPRSHTHGGGTAAIEAPFLDAIATTGQFARLHAHARARYRQPRASIVNDENVFDLLSAQESAVLAAATGMRTTPFRVVIVDPPVCACYCMDHHDDPLPDYTDVRTSDDRGRSWRQARVEADGSVHVLPSYGRGGRNGFDNLTPAQQRRLRASAVGYMPPSAW